MNPHAWFLADLERVPQNGLRCVSTFSCGGGSSMGYKRAGFDVMLANDIDPEMAWHYQHNLKPRHYALCPIKDLVSRLPPSAFGVDLLDGSPPCSSFSTAGLREKAWGKAKKFREGQVTQVLDDLFFDFLDVAEAVRPRAIVAENVSGLIKGNARGYVTLIFERLRKAGYRPQMFLVNASRCGVPQSRERVFVCAQRDDKPRRELKLSLTTPVVTAGEACADLQRLTDDQMRETAAAPFDRKWWPLTGPLRSYADAVKRERGKEGLFSHVRLAANAPAPTLTARWDGFKHWAELRRLTFQEWKRLGSFPDDYHAKTPLVGKYMIGMSVPPKMAECVAIAVRDQWLA